MKNSPTYAELLRRGMRAKGMSRRQLERATKQRPHGGYSYEHIRKIVSGQPLMSEQFNADICSILELDADYMWQIAVKEKLAQSKFAKSVTINLPDNNALREAWEFLSDADRIRVVNFARALADERRVLHRDGALQDATQIRQRIVELMDRLPLAAAPIENMKKTYAK